MNEVNVMILLLLLFSYWIIGYTMIAISHAKDTCQMILDLTGEKK